MSVVIPNADSSTGWGFDVQAGAFGYVRWSLGDGWRYISFDDVPNSFDIEHLCDVWLRAYPPYVERLPIWIVAACVGVPTLVLWRRRYNGRDRATSVVLDLITVMGAAILAGLCAGTIGELFRFGDLLAAAFGIDPQLNWPSFVVVRGLGAAGFVLGAGFALARVKRSRRVLGGHCGRCHYDLTGNQSGRCPECGSAILRLRGTK